MARSCLDKWVELLVKVKVTGEGLLSSGCPNVWTVAGGLERLTINMLDILSNGLRSDPYMNDITSRSAMWEFLQQLRWHDPVCSPDLDRCSKQPISERAKLYIKASLREHALSRRLQILEQGGAVVQYYTEDAFLRQAVYFEALLTCLQAVETNHKGLLAQINPNLVNPTQQLRKLSRTNSSDKDSRSSQPNSTFLSSPGGRASLFHEAIPDSSATDRISSLRSPGSDENSQELIQGLGFSSTNSSNYPSTCTSVHPSSPPSRTSTLPQYSANSLTSRPTLRASSPQPIPKSTMYWHQTPTDPLAPRRLSTKTEPSCGRIDVDVEAPDLLAGQPPMNHAQLVRSLHAECNDFLLDQGEFEQTSVSLPMFSGFFLGHDDPDICRSGGVRRGLSGTMRSEVIVDPEFLIHGTPPNLDDYWRAKYHKQSTAMTKEEHLKEKSRRKEKKKHKRRACESETHMKSIQTEVTSFSTSSGSNQSDNVVETDLGCGLSQLLPAGLINNLDIPSDYPTPDDPDEASLWQDFYPVPLSPPSSSSQLGYGPPQGTSEAHRSTLYNRIDREATQTNPEEEESNRGERSETIKTESDMNPSSKTDNIKTSASAKSTLAVKETQVKSGTKVVDEPKLANNQSHGSQHKKEQTVGEARSTVAEQDETGSHLTALSQKQQQTVRHQRSQSDVGLDLRDTLGSSRSRSYLEEEKAAAEQRLSSSVQSHRPRHGLLHKPTEGQSLISFLSSHDFHTCAELDRENAHFVICETLISAIETMKWNQILNPNPEEQDGDSDEEIQQLKQRIRIRRRERLQEKAQQLNAFSDGVTDTTETTTGSGTSDAGQESDEGDYSDSSSDEVHDEELEEADAESSGSNLTALKSSGLSLSMASLYSDQDLYRANQRIQQSLEHQRSQDVSNMGSAESIAISLLRSFKEQRLPKASELEWLVSEDATPQHLLPMPKSVPVSPGDEVTGSKMRGNLQWAPPRQQIIFTLQRPAKLQEALEKQKFLCAGCGRKADKGHLKRFKFCEYLGKYFCPCCHANEMVIIPARVLHLWDFKPHPVSDFAKKLLQKIHNEPLFTVDTINPSLYKKVKELNSVYSHRIQLYHLSAYIQTCRLTSWELEAFKTCPNHWLQPAHHYSMADLTSLKQGQLLQRLDELITTGMTHVQKCELCKAKGFYCETCRAEDTLFPFMTADVIQCESCQACFHKKCFDIRNCPKCARIEARRRLLQDSPD